ncbi:glycine betaine ABC transporter substrate-binding protein [Streptomyces sp. DG2A-72]|uniref:ABC transporter substrate-binding protein n=1 Tax=Streptomyces sp. DG2A-72 TaxID=3051386 RepID=UPI00265C0351|nr:glycine betaine ABC transporter substrate-binding protein [Streptomyces sp. DG2A-72]MDO0931138.1 glycine betaine ABC transporter substrate-binding protein [Streptomyces sp. DG2A-72]
MNRPRRRLGALLAVLSLTAVCAGCSSTSSDLPSSVSAGQLRGGSIAKAVDLSGKSFTVGSKEFTEQTVLGNILIYALQAAGAKTKDQTGLTGSAIVRKALLGGDIDMYWEYAGTGWSEFLKKTSVLPGAKEQFDETARLDQKQNKITWLGPAKFGDQYAIARAGDAKGPAGKVDKLSQLKQLAKDHPGEVTLCGAAEFLDREIGPLQKVYDVRIPPTQVYQNAFALNFVNVAKQSPCNFAEVFTTDSRIKSLGLKVVEDDKTHFLTQLVGLTLREKTARENPELKRLVRLLGDKLTQQVIIELNGMVDIDGASPQQAAVKFLKDEGFIA